MKKIIKPGSLLILYLLLAWYSTQILEDYSKGYFLIDAWEKSFTKMGVWCIYWIALRLSMWSYAFLFMLRMETPLTVYLFVRKRNYLSLFLKRYVRCIAGVALGYCLAMTVMEGYFAFAVQGESFIDVIGQKELVSILLRESLDCLNVCLVGYFVYCCSKRMEYGFAFAIIGRILLELVLQRRQIEIGAGIMLCINVVMAFGVLKYSAYNFMERIREGA